MVLSFAIPDSCNYYLFFIGRLKLRVIPDSAIHNYSENGDLDGLNESIAEGADVSDCGFADKTHLCIGVVVTVT